MIGRRNGGDANARYSVLLLPCDGVSRDSRLYEQWEELAEDSGNLYAFYQSPSWWNYSLQGTLRDYILRLHESGKPDLLALSGPEDSLVGAIGINRSFCPLAFQFRSRTLLRLRVRAIKVLGGQPLVREEEEVYVALVRALFAAFPDCDCIYLESVPVGSFCWNVLCTSQSLRKHCELYVPGEPVLHARITLPGSFAQYVGKFKSKTRYNLQRQVRQLREHGGGQLAMVRVEHARDVAEFLDQAAAISAVSWQSRTLGLEVSNSPAECEMFAHFAARGTLRSYLLRCGGSPTAFVRGFQHGDVFYYLRIGFDERVAKFSPGTVLLYLLIEDLFNHRPPRYLNFQEGDWAYKRLFATDYLQKSSVLIVRKEAKVSSRWPIKAHGTYRCALDSAKRLIHWKSGSNDNGH